MKVRPVHVVGLGAALTFILAGMWLKRVAGAHVVGRALTPEGGEMCVVQKFNWSGEPYTTSFVFRKPGSQTWGWYYFDHEDTYWSRSEVVVDTNLKVATFYRKGLPAVSFEWETGVYRREGAVWATGAQHQLDKENWIPRLLDRP